MTASYPSLTREQREAADARDAVLDRALRALRDIDFPHDEVDEEGDFGCRRCGCDGFVMPAPPHALTCRRPTCGHGFFSHRVE